MKRAEWNEANHVYQNAIRVMDQAIERWDTMINLYRGGR